MAKIYRVINIKENTRLIKLTLQQDKMSLSHLKYTSYLGLIDALFIVENNRFGTILPGFALAPPIMDGDGRAINYNMRYKQLRKLYGFYISLGKSIYFHNYRIGNTKRCSFVYMRNYQLFKKEDINSSCSYSSAVYVESIQDNEKYYGFKITIEDAYDKKEENKKSLKYRKANLPIYRHPANKIDDDMAYTRGMFVCTHIIYKYRPIDRVLFKPIRLPAKDVKGIIAFKRRRDRR